MTAREDSDPTLGRDESPRYCPNCSFEIPASARTCGHCGERVDDRFPHVDEGSYRFARMVLLESIKHDISNWLRVVTVRTSGGLVLVAALAYFGFDDLVGAIVRARFQQVVDDSIELAQEQVDELHETSTDLQGRLTELQSQSDEHEATQTTLGTVLDQLQHDAADSAGTTEQLHLKQIVRLRAELLERTSRAALAEARPDVFLRSPCSLEGEFPETIYGRGDLPIRFEWTAAEPLDGTLSQFRVQLSRTADFAAVDDVAEFETPFHGIALHPSEIANGLGLERLRGELFWRVVSNGEGAEPMVGCFEYYENALDRIQQTGEVRVGIAGTESPPFIQRVPGSPYELMGLDYELAGAVASMLQKTFSESMPAGWKPRTTVRMYDWLTLLAAPSRNEVEFIISSITIDEEREALYAIEFSRPYHETVQSLVLSERVASLESLDDLDELRLAAPKGTTGAKAARMHAVDQNHFRECITTQEALTLIANGQADGAILDYEIAADWAKHYPSLRAQRLDEITVTDGGPRVTSESHPEFFDRYGIAVSQTETRLLRFIDANLEFLEERELPRLRSGYLTAGLEAPDPTAVARGPVPGR